MLTTGSISTASSEPFNEAVEMLAVGSLSFFFVF